MSTGIATTARDTAGVERVRAWLDVREPLERQLYVIGGAIIDRLDLRPGAHVLDIGCGIERTVERLAKIVGPTGRVLGSMAESERIMGLVKRIHSLSVAGEAGNVLVEIVAGWVIVLVATGGGFLIGTPRYGLALLPLFAVPLMSSRNLFVALAMLASAGASVLSYVWQW